MNVDPQAAFDAAAGYLTDVCEAFGDRSTFEDRDGAMLALSGLPVAFANGVWIIRPEAKSTTVESMLDQAIASGAPFLFVAQEERRDEWTRVAERVGLSFAEDTPLMVATDIADLEMPDTPMTFRREGPDAFDDHIRLVADAFDTPAEIFDELMRGTAGMAGLRVYVGLADREVVSTALSMATPGPSVGIFSVATPEAFRGRGYGYAITAHAVKEAAAAGAQWAWLQSSEAGYGVYERMGFRTVARQPMWMYPAA